MTAQLITLCRYAGCSKPATTDQSRCPDHRLRWLAGRDPEPAPTSPWVRLALAGKLPPSAA